MVSCRAVVANLSPIKIRHGGRRRKRNLARWPPLTLNSTFNSSSHISEQPQSHIARSKIDRACFAESFNVLFLGLLIRSSCTILEETDFKRGRLNTYGTAHTFYRKLARDRYHCRITVRYGSGSIVGDKLIRTLFSVVWYYPMLDS